MLFCNYICFTPTVKYPVGITSVPDRTKEGVESDMVEAFRTGVNVRGIKGLLPFINLPGFDIVWSFNPDYMKFVLLGVTLQFLELWLSNVGAAYYIGSPQLQKEFDERLCHIKSPQCMPRLPRSVKLRKYWKPVEWQQWLLYISLVCIGGILPDRSLTPFSLLVRGIFLLLQDEVSTTDISDSTDCLVRFIVGVQFLCLVTSAKGVIHQVMTRIMMAHKVIACKAEASPRIKDSLRCVTPKEEPVLNSASKDLWKDICLGWLRRKLLSRSQALLWNMTEYASLGVCSTAGSTTGPTGLTAQQ